MQYTGGDIKAVQGDTGHSQAAMVTQVYGHTFDENRKRIAGLMENEFFTSEDKKTDSVVADKENKIMEILKSSPELADLILALKNNDH